MVNEVNKLIFNTLVEHGAVCIPNVGTLAIYRISSRIKSGRVDAPTYNVAFTTNCASLSINTIIASKALVSQEVADDIVNRWLKKAMVDGTLSIEGVGKICNGVYTPDNELITMLNSNNQSVVIGRKKARAWLIALSIIVLCAVAGTAVYIYINRTDNANRVVIDEQHSHQDIIPATPETTVDNQEIVDAVDVDETADSLPTNQTQEVTPMPEPTVESASEVDEVITPSEESPAAQVIVNDWRHTAVRHYVIFGSYSNMTNANNAVRKILRRNPAAQCKIIPLGTMHAVAVYGSYSRSDCERFKRQYRSLYKDSWIHTPKRFR